MQTTLLIQLSREDLEDIIAAAIHKAAIAPGVAGPQEDKLLTAEETMIELDVTRPTLAEWERNGTLKPVRKGRRVYYLKSDLTKR